MKSSEYNNVGYPKEEEDDEEDYEDEEEEDSEDEEEPKLKYHRLPYISDILVREQPSCIAVHDKFLVQS